MRRNCPNCCLVFILLACAGAVAGSRPALAVPVFQESQRTVDKPGRFDKHLTPGLVDRWLFQGKAGETVIVEVATAEFDAVLELVRKNGDGEEVLREYDDEGNNCRLSCRLDADGEYRIRVHGFELRGGGNYQIELQQVMALPLRPGEKIRGRIGEDSRACFRFQSESDRFYSVDFGGREKPDFQVLGLQGEPLEEWNSLVRLKKAGEYLLSLSGPVGQPFELTLAPASRKTWAGGTIDGGLLEAGTAEILDLEGRAGEFQLIEIGFSGQLVSRLVPMPADEEGERRMNSQRERPAIVLLPVSSKGRFLRYAVICGQTGRYQLQLVSALGAGYRGSLGDASIPVASGVALSAELPVGNTVYCRMNIEAGQTLEAALESESFDSLLTVFDSSGRAVTSNDDGGGGMGSRISHTAYSPTTLLFGISSAGGGGGGGFRFSVDSREPPLLVPGQGVSGEAPRGGATQWRLQGSKGQSLVLHLRGAAGRPGLVLRDNSGLVLGQAGPSGHETQAALAIELPEDGSYLLEVSLPEGGTYHLRAFESD